MKRKITTLILIIAILTTYSNHATAGTKTIMNEIKGLIYYYHYQEAPYELYQIENLDVLIQELGDPYATYIAPNQSREIIDTITSDVGDVGITLEKSGDKILIVSVTPGSDAAEQQLQTGDVVLTIAGMDLGDMEMKEIIQLLPGKLGSNVELTVMQGEKVKTITLQRENLKSSTIWYETLNDDAIGYINIKTFGTNTPFELQRALSYLDKGKKVQGIILDLRNNQGGAVESVIDVAELLIPQAPVTHIVNNQKIAKIRYTTGKGLDKPMVVLVNSGTASAAEILASAIQDNQVGTIVGTRTYGKSAIQSMYRLSDGGSFMMTTAQYLTPRGNIIHLRGLTPDYVVTAPGKQLEKAQEILRKQLEQGEEINPNKVTTWVFMDVGKPNYYVNGWEMSFGISPFVYNNATYVPLRAVLENMGGFVSYDLEHKLVRVLLNGNNITYSFTNNDTSFNGQVSSMKYPLLVRDGRTFIHVRHLAEQLGATVNWNQEFQRISIYL